MLIKHFTEIALVVIVIITGTSNSFHMKGTSCTEFKEVSSYAEYLKAFQKGPCSPIIFAHGLMGSGLQVRVDCETFKVAKESNDSAMKVFNSCPFMCQGDSKFYENTIWVTNKPFWEYVLNNDFNFVWKNRECAVLLFQVHKRIVNKSFGFAKGILETEGLKMENFEIPGIQVRILGDTEQTRDLSKCGRTASTQFFGAEPTVYEYVMENFETLGYVQGVTIQNLAYDFRKSATTNHSREKLKLSLKILKTFTGKRSMIFGHSYGNNVILNGLKTLSQEERDDYVEEYVAISSPFMGSFESLFFLLGNAGWIYFPVIKNKLGFSWISEQFDGINPHFAKEVYPYVDGLYETVPQPGQVRKVYDLVKAQLGALQRLGFGQEFLEDVLDDAKKTLEQELITKLNNFDPSVKKYYLKELDDIIKKFSFSDFIKLYYKQFDYEGLSISENPGVPSRIVLLREIPTSSKITIFEDPMTSIKNGKFPKTEKFFSKGDQTVNLFSLALSPLMWISEYSKSQTILSGTSDRFNIKDTRVNSKTTPKKVTIVEFGPQDSKKYSEFYEYVHCNDDPKPKGADKEMKDFNKKSAKKESWTSFLFGRVLPFTKEILDLFNQNNNNNAPLIKPHGFNGTKKKGEMYGTHTCNHSNIVVNKEYMDYINKIILTPKNDKIDSSKIADFSLISDETFESYYHQCPVITCHEGVESCWKEFKKIFNLGA